VLDDSGRCIVPALRFDDLKAAKLALANHSCRLGKVRRRSPHHLPAKDLRVKAQGVKAGKLRPHGARIAITLAE
jgi:hypothetical protein